MASLLKRKGVYYAQFHDQSRTPQRRRLSLRTKRKATARRLLTKLEEDWRLGRFDPWTDDPHSYDSTWTRAKRRRLEFAEVVRALAEEVYPDAETIRLICDNLNTHSAAAFYERYPPEEARRLAERVELVYTPVHGSWLNVVEVEFSVLVRQRLGRRIGTLQALKREVEAWTAARNAEGATVDWQFRTEDARIKLRCLYPSVSA